eukprot:6125910-Pleurochrysis_carterae.AAC.1
MSSATRTRKPLGSAGTADASCATGDVRLGTAGALDSEGAEAALCSSTCASDDSTCCTSIRTSICASGCEFSSAKGVWPPD